MPQTATVPALATACCLLLGLSLAAPAARSAEPRLIGSFRDWEAYKVEEADGPACFMSSQPKRQQGDFSKRGAVFALITHRPAEKAVGVVSLVAGYAFAKETEVTVKVGERNFTLFTDTDTAWTRDEGTDRALVQAIRTAGSMVVRGTSSRGTRTVDTYSLAGSSAAYEAISEACGVK